MTIVNKKINAVKSVEKKFSFKNFSFGNSQKEKTLCADYAAAVKTENGKLKAAFLWEEFTEGNLSGKMRDTQNGVLNLMEVTYCSNGEKERRFFYLAGTGFVYMLTESKEEFMQNGLFFSDKPTILSAYTLDGQENLLYCSSTDGVSFFNTYETNGVKVLEKGSTLACLVGDRAFVAQGERVYYCEPLAFEKWENSQNGGGFLDFSSELGKIVGLADVDGKLGVFFKRAVVVMSVRSGAKEFERRDVSFPFGDILQGSVVSSGNMAVFLTANGGFSFDGEKFEKTLPKETFGEIKKDGDCESFSFQGDAYIIYTLQDGKKRLFVYNAKSKEGYFVEDPKGEGFTPSKERLFCYRNGKIYVLSENGDTELSSNSGFSFKGADFMGEGEKTIKSMKFTGSGQARIAVSSERGGHVYTITLAKDGSMVCPLLKGKDFTINLIPKKGCEITGAEINVVYARR